MTRTSFNISKINLQGASSYPRQQLQHSESKRYTGPRVSFYAQMNPRMSRRSSSCFDPEEDHSSKSYIPKKEMTGKMVRDQSIKYLQIIE